MTDARSRTVAFVCHCLLNQNAKVVPLANHRGAFEPLVRELLDAGVGMVQLPCPELAVHGVARPLGTDTVEQYDTPGYRETCRAIAAQTVKQMLAYQRADYRVACLLGVEGSPSCSVEKKRLAALRPARPGRSWQGERSTPLSAAARHGGWHEGPTCPGPCWCSASRDLPHQP